MGKGGFSEENIITHVMGGELNSGGSDEEGEYVVAMYATLGQVLQSRCVPSMAGVGEAT